MDWLFDNLGKLAPVVIFLIYMISSLKGRREEEEEPDPQAAERARRIQEEIRRKILERQKGNAPSTQEEPRPVAREMERTEPTPFEPLFESERTPLDRPPVVPKPRYVEEPAAAQSAFVDDEMERRQREVEKKLEAAKRAKEEASKKAAAIQKNTSAYMKDRSRSVSGSVLKKRLLTGLGNPSSLRTSVLLKEVLDKPVGLR